MHCCTISSKLLFYDFNITDNLKSSCADSHQSQNVAGQLNAAFGYVLEPHVQHVSDYFKLDTHSAFFQWALFRNQLKCDLFYKTYHHCLSDVLMHHLQCK